MKNTLGSHVHGISLFAILYLLGKVTEYHFLEAAIVIILMYEIGYTIPFMDYLIDRNEDLLRLLIKLFKKPIRRRRSPK